jgi:hypothetical protein
MMMKLFFILLAILYLLPTKVKTEARCTYAGSLYECGSKLPNGQYCNLIDCGTGCCQIVLCNRYVQCYCQYPNNNMYQCKNALVLKSFNETGKIGVTKDDIGFGKKLTPTFL